MHWKNDYKSKIFPPYDPHPYKVVEKKGSMVTARRDSRSVTRNSSFFKHVVKLERKKQNAQNFVLQKDRKKILTSLKMLNVKHEKLLTLLKILNVKHLKRKTPP
jgi:hypothetical protein